MARLPVVGDDPGAWGDVLNEYLEVAHNPDGTAKGGGSTGAEHNVVDYGATLDGTTDDSGAIQDAIDAAYTAGGGVVLIPGRWNTNLVIINSTLELRSGVWLKGLGAATSLGGSANPMIQIKQDMVHDRMQISDLFLQDPNGAGIVLETSGALQLGWPRITIENVTVADAVSHSFYVSASIVIECRFINCVAMRSGDTAFFNGGTDNFFIGCTGAETGGSGHGFHTLGGNSKFVACKAYGNNGDGFHVAGGGRHVLAGCESQDNANAGFNLQSGGNSLSGIVADSDYLAGVFIISDSNNVQGSFVSGGGGTGQVPKSGVLFHQDAEYNVVSGSTNLAVPVGGQAEGNSVRITSDSRRTITYTSPWTPNPYVAEVQAMTLTGNLTLVNPVYKHVGQRLTLELQQDGTGGRTMTFPNDFRTNWTPSTTATHLNTITFVYDGTAWQQVASVVGLTARPSIGVGDTFNRANEVLNVSSSGHTWTRLYGGAGAWNVVSNQARTVGADNVSIAVLDAGVADFTVQVTLVTANATLIWRYVDAANFFQASSNTVSKIVAGVTVPVGAGMLNFVAGDVAKVVTSGPNHFIYNNGTLIYVFSDTSHLSATKAGLRAESDSDIFDAFTIA